MLLHARDSCFNHDEFDENQTFASSSIVLFLRRQDEGGIDIVMTLNVFYLLLFRPVISSTFGFCCPSVYQKLSCPNV